MKKSEKIAIMQEVIECGADWRKARKISQKMPPSTVIPFELYRLALDCAYIIRDPADKGASGRIKEIMNRMHDYMAMSWQDCLYNRPSNKPDEFVNGRRIEVKSGAGDWFYAHCSDKAAALAEMRTCKKLYKWDADEFYILLPLNELMTLLDGYNGDCSTFFTMGREWSKGRIVKMQTFSTSKKKIKFLQSLEDFSL